MATTKNTAIVFATATAFIWGLSFLSIKATVVVIPPMSLGLIRFSIASVMLLVLFAILRRRPKIAAKDLPLMLGSSLVGYTLYFLGENNGVLLLTASEASIIIGTIPVFTMLSEHLFTRTKLSAAQYAGAGLSAAGVTLIVVESLRLSLAPLGYLYMGFAAISWVVYAFMTKPLLSKYDSLEVTLWQTLFGAAGFVPFALFEHIEWAAVTPVIIANVLYLGVFCSALGYLFYIISLKVLGAGVSSVFINLIPVVSVVAAFLIFGERLSPLQLAGGGIAVGGVYLASLAGSRQKRSGSQ